MRPSQARHHIVTAAFSLFVVVTGFRVRVCPEQTALIVTVIRS